VVVRVTERNDRSIVLAPDWPAHLDQGDIEVNNIMERRWFLRIAVAGAAGSALAISGSASASANAPVRTSLKYQDKPAANGDKCAGCTHFVPGKAPTDKGGCKIITGDTEISPSGWCVAYAKKP